MSHHKSEGIKMATFNDNIPFDKAIQEINGIIKLAGLTWFYSFGKNGCSAWEHHAMEMLYTQRPEEITSSEMLEASPALQKKMKAFLSDDDANISCAIRFLGAYILKLSAYLQIPSPLYDEVINTSVKALMQVANEYESQMTPKAPDTQTKESIAWAAKIVRNIADALNPS